MKNLYREETNHDVYADYCCEKPAGSYADEYVRWLEEKLSKLSQHDVSRSDGCLSCENNLPEKGYWCATNCIKGSMFKPSVH